MHKTRHCYDVGMVSHYQANPGMMHWKAVKRILRYLKVTTDYSLCYQGKELRLVGYLDVDWAGDLEEHKSTSGYIFLLNNGVILWKQEIDLCDFVNHGSWIYYVFNYNTRSCMIEKIFAKLRNSQGCF